MMTFGSAVVLGFGVTIGAVIAVGTIVVIVGAIGFALGLGE